MTKEELQKAYDDAVAQVDKLTFKLEEAEEKLKKWEEKSLTVGKGAKEFKELVFRLLWQAHRMPRCATTKEITQNLPKLRQWVGEAEAEELEKKWRRG